MGGNLEIPRRRFLISAALLSAGGARGDEAETQLHPTYRTRTQLDDTLAKTKTGLDAFVAEKEHDRIAAVLAEWSAEWAEAPGKLQAVAKAMASDFRGCSPRPVSAKTVRAGDALTVRRVTYSRDAALGSEAFINALRTELSSYSKILTAELQVTRIELRGPAVLTRVRYDLVGTGAGFYREQRTGYWDLEWSPDHVRRWSAAEETRSRAAAPWFADVTTAAFAGNESYARQLMHGVDYWRTVLDGACGIDVYGHNGVSVGDIDGDGFDDLYVCQPAGLPNRLYRNRGDGTFEDITAGSGVGILENSACALIADFDNDGRQDLVVVRANGPLLFLNQGGGRFLRKPDAFRFANPPRGTFTGAAVADYNRDGLLDVYFCLYSYYQGAGQYRYPVPYYAAENGPPNFLMRNNGDGTFSDATAAAKLSVNNTRYSFACGWSDYNGDGWPDLYVVNDFGRKNLYRNNGDGTFTDVAAEMGVEDAGAGMSVGWLDYDDDGADDLYVANMWTAAGERITMEPEFQTAAPGPVRALYRKHAMGNSLLRNRGAKFEDVTMPARVGNGRWAWSSEAWDFDHDGFMDLYVVNGMLSGTIREDLNGFFWRQVVANSPTDARPETGYEQGWNAINELVRSDYTWSGYERNVLFANHRDGTFTDVSGAVGLDFVEDGRSFALADFDRDGRLEALVKNRNAPQVRLMKNVVERLPPSIAFRLRGVKSNRDAIGAVVTVETTAGRQTRSLQVGSGFLSQHSKDLHFGLGEATGTVKATIRWPSALVQTLHDLAPGQLVHVEEGKAPSRLEPFRTAASVRAHPQPEGEALPGTMAAWLLVPVPAPDAAGGQGAHLVTVRADDSPERAAVYNILYRYIFDRHRDLTLPASFLVDEQGNVVKVYRGPVSAAQAAEDARRIPRTAAERLARALPFAGVSETYEYGRNNLSLGSAFFQRGYYEESAGAFRMALRADPASAEAEYGLGSVYLKQERNSDARASFERAVKLTATYPDTMPNAWNNLGLLATREGRMDEAAAHFRHALEVSPNYWIALENLGNTYRLQKRWEEARQTLGRAQAERPDDPEASYNLAMVYAQTDDPERAHAYLQKALQLRPVYPEALNNLGILYLRTRRRDEAVARFEECIRVAPDFDQAYLNLARVYALEDAPEKARAVLRELLKRHPDHAAAQRALEQLR